MGGPKDVMMVTNHFIFIKFSYVKFLGINLNHKNGPTWLKRNRVAQNTPFFEINETVYACLLAREGVISFGGS